MPPGNDNFANAQVLNPAATSIGAGGGSNEGATAEAGEPANQGKTVWYKITIPEGFPGSLFFSTTNSTFTPPLRTVLQAFTGATVSALQEVPYLAPFKVAYGGWDYGSYIAFNVLPNEIYYIRVDGVAGLEGKFPLNYGAYYNLRLGSCSRCAPVFGYGYACEGYTGVGYVPTDNPVLTFGKNNYPPGVYIVRYCGGAHPTHYPHFSYGFVGLSTVPIGGLNQNLYIPYEFPGGDVWLVTYPAAASVNYAPFWTVYYNGADAANPTGLPETHPTQRARSNGVATLTIAGHGYRDALSINVSGVGGTGYAASGALITIVDANHISYPSGGPNEAVTADGGGTVTPVSIAPLLNVPVSTDWRIIGTIDLGGGQLRVAQLDFYGYESQAAAENASRCIYAQLIHTGGNIRIALLAGNSVGSGNPSPSWGLYRISPVLQLSPGIPACAVWVAPPSGGGTASVTFNIENKNDADWRSVTATLLATGGVLSPGTVQNITLARNGVTGVTVPFSALNHNVTATIKLSCPFWSSDIQFTVFLGPIFQLSSSNGPFQDLTSGPFVGRLCGGKHIQDILFTLNNLGYWSLSGAALQVTAAATNGVLVGPYNTDVIFGPHGPFSATACPTAASLSQGSSAAGCSAAFDNTFALVAPAGAAAPVATVLTLTFTSNGSTLFTQAFPLTIPL